MEIDVKNITQRLENYNNFILSDPNSHFKKSAVLILLLLRENAFHMILTARTKNLSHHSGEMSFPGGRYDPKMDKSLKNTALREVAEEIGVEASQIRILGRLNDTPTLTGYNISSFIGFISNSHSISYKQNFGEVADIVEIPLEFFTQSDVIKERSLPMQFGKAFLLLSCEYLSPDNQKSYHIWGATAHIIADFFEVCLNTKITSPQYIRPTLKDLLDYTELVKNQKKRGEKGRNRIK
ncbi:MAG: NUDIX hydrolase [Promethearchaeota archaeon]